MSSWLSGGGRAAYKLDLEIIKSPSTSWTSQSSSPSSTLSESSNSPIAISTRKPRTPRKRPNQTYNEAAALLSTAYPKIFNTKHLTKPWKFPKPHYPLLYESSDLVVPYKVVENSGFLLHPPLLEKPNCPIEQRLISRCDKPCQSPGEIDSKGNSFLEVCDEFQEDFDEESILDEEIEEGVIDNIMGKLNVENESTNESNFSYSRHQHNFGGTCYGFPIGLGFENGYLQYDFGMRNGARPLRNVDDGDWWRYPSVNVIDITPKFSKPPIQKKKKKVERLVELRSSKPSSAKDKSTPKRTNKDNSSQSTKEEVDVPKPKSELLLKLNYDNVLHAWYDKESPFSDEMPGSEAAGNDVQARLAQIDLFSENGGMREAGVLRYKEKRRTRVFIKKNFTKLESQH
ncbi:protein CHLOROPLAST IMPORT APPARATUS 2 [Nicotiana tabacum]|uniref:Protein CHLOROPLAST IMPORT APPARATUS 2 n=2 Tax=Nicotiana TaxID=4085 RepID=A0A1S3ZE74_TOBAC|nr:PREDICTED: protein CHLOROPLAST IMPORT APPARATUS 2-like [Nicotiana sylvestris]XP_009780117.1 PREDICTED: protein CHLOROPLAST IMPORT APPARATUS 2-like [Nicotiana sylvestris]XP_016462572.1 PREDICTED: protein CHLOROPLAST IMPORT APPARATUS 2-like [Nicotiana tabacum]XP_016462573.1 PREDICTED: protein CHLOROPLAST IMPORT APPARATUS 2-like [Nicotiana tabacum]